MFTWGKAHRWGTFYARDTRAFSFCATMMAFYKTLSGSISKAMSRFGKTSGGRPARDYYQPSIRKVVNDAYEAR